MREKKNKIVYLPQWRNMCSVRPNSLLVTTYEKKKMRRRSVLLDSGGQTKRKNESEKRDGFIEKQKPQKKQMIENRNLVTRSIKNAFWSIFDQRLISRIHKISGRKKCSREEKKTVKAKTFTQIPLIFGIRISFLSNAKFKQRTQTIASDSISIFTFRESLCLIFVTTH